MISYYILSRQVGMSTMDINLICIMLFPLLFSYYILNGLSHESTYSTMPAG